VKSTHHAIFDEAWYLQPRRPPFAQMLYDIGLEFTQQVVEAPPSGPPQKALYPPMCKPPSLVKLALVTPLPLRLSSPPDVYLHAAAAKSQTGTLLSDIQLTGPCPSTKQPLDHEMMLRDDISRKDLMMVYLSPHPFRDSFEEEFRLRLYNHQKHPTAGLICSMHNGRLYLQDILPGTPAAKIRAWRSRLKGAWLIKVDDEEVCTTDQISTIMKRLADRKATTCRLLLAHSDLKHGQIETGIPQINADQLNQRYSFDRIDVMSQEEFDLWFARLPRCMYDIVNEGGVLNMVTVSNKLTRRILLQQDDWDEWSASEFIQLDQYAKQHMFGDPCQVTKTSAVFNLIWTYVIKELDGRKKARCTCDGSTRGGQVRILDHTFANSIDQTGSRIFYAVAAAENLLVFGADVSNAFGEAPPPKQGFYIRPDTAFCEWYKARYGKDIPQGYVVPVLAAMQGHPESPRLWEKHCDRILRKIGLTPTTHEPCLYSGTMESERVYFKRQVDDFAIACKQERTATIIFDAIDFELQIPIKRQGLLTLFNGLDVLQSRWYIKISVQTYLSKTLAPYFKEWLDIPSKPMPVPLGTNEKFHTELYKAIGDPDVKIQAALAKRMGFGYRKAIGELIWPMTTCRPDLSQAVVKCSQASASPTETHYNAIKSIFRYLAATMTDGIYFWRTEARLDLPDDELPTIHSTPHDLRMQGRPKENALNLCGYMDASWGDCLLTRRSTGGACFRLAGGPVAWKAQLLPTVALSSTEAEYMEATVAGRISLYIRSILWDLGIPQEAATILYEDNDGATAMVNAGKPTSRSRHIDIKYYAIQEWVERDLIILHRIDTAMNIADHYTKPLPRLLFYRHNDYNMGRVPPTYSPKFLECLRVYSSPDQKSKTKQKEYTARAAKTMAPWEIIVSSFYGSTFTYSASTLSE
jgi:hypothetical protein